MRSYLLSGACAASMLLALTPGVQAADMLAPEPHGMGWYVSVFGGWSMADDEDIFYENTTAATPFEFEADVELDDGFMAGLAAGTQFNEWLRAEVEVSGHWHDAGGDAELSTAIAPATYALSGDEDALFLLANLWIDLPIDELIRPYIGGGIGFGRLDVDISGENTVGPVTVDLIDDADWGFAYQLGAGIAFDFSPNMAIDLGYRYKRINDIELEANATAITGIEIEKDYKSHNVLLGVRFGF
jgi:opacity protein-like surface antigen